MVKPLTKIGGGSGKCHYEIFDGAWKSQWVGLKQACHSEISRAKDKQGHVILYLPIKDMAYSETDIIRWLKYLSTISFKTTYLGVQDISKHGVYIDLVDKCYVVKLNNADYVNYFHIFNAVTAIRYVHYTYHYLFIEIPQKVFEIRNKLKVDGVQALQLAYHLCGCYESAHAFIGKSQQDYYPTTANQFKEKLESKKFEMINSILNNKISIPAATVHSLYNTKKYSKLQTLINKVYE